jgi:hypothetical protein
VTPGTQPAICLFIAAHGQPVVIDGGKAGIAIELDANTGKLPETVSP